MIHIVPINDTHEHDTESTMCWCNPKVNWNDPDTGEAYAEAMVIHNAADCREIVEEAEALMSNTKLTTPKDVVE